MLGRLWQRARAEADFPALRAGLHHGEATRRGAQFFGTAVNLAARVAAQAGVGQVLLTDPVATAARDLGLPVLSIAVALKNLRDAVELYRVELDDTEVEHIDPICRMRVRPDTARAHLTLDGKEYWFCSPECLREFVARHS